MCAVRTFSLCFGTYIHTRASSSSSQHGYFFDLPRLAFLFLRALAFGGDDEEKEDEGCGAATTGEGADKEASVGTGVGEVEEEGCRSRPRSSTRERGSYEQNTEFSSSGTTGISPSKHT